MSNTKGNHVNEEDPPEEIGRLIRIIRYFLCGDNLRRIWDVILVSVFILLGGAVFAKLDLILKYLFPVQQHADAPQDPSSSRQPYPLRDDQVPIAISNALVKADLATAIRILEGLKPGQLRKDECIHLHGFSIQNRTFDEADHIIDLCFSGSEKERKKQDLTMLKMQQ